MNALDAEREVRLPPWYVRYAEFDGIAVVLSDEDADPDALQLHPPSGARVYVGWIRLPFGDCLNCTWMHRSASGGETLWRGDDPEEAERQFHEAEIRLLRGEFSDE